jgi:hypothetical protein
MLDEPGAVNGDIAAGRQAAPKGRGRMMHSGPTDPWSSFLNATRSTSGPGPGSAAPGPTARSELLRVLLAGRDRGPRPLSQLSRELGLRTTQVAVLAATLDLEGLVTISVDGDDDVIALTDAGEAAARSTLNEGR